jgi:hypothetical protein
VHTSNVLRDTARQEKNKMIQAAANVGRVSTVEILSKIKSNLERSSHPQATSSIRKSRTLSKAIQRAKRKILGHSSTIPKIAEEIKENLPAKFAGHHLRQRLPGVLRLCGRSEAETVDGLHERS